MNTLKCMSTVACIFLKWQIHGWRSEQVCVFVCACVYLCRLCINSHLLRCCGLFQTVHIQLDVLIGHCCVNRELSQGDAASYATQEATNLDGTVPYKRFRNWATQLSRVIVCVHVMRERIPSPRKVSDWQILQLRGFQYDPIFWRLP